MGGQENLQNQPLGDKCKHSWGQPLPAGLIPAEGKCLGDKTLGSSLLGVYRQIAYEGSRCGELRGALAVAAHRVGEPTISQYGCGGPGCLQFPQRGVELG